MSSKLLPKDLIERARALWDTGMKASAIGDRLGKSKSSIIGLAHRNGFTPRPNPVGLAGAKVARRPREPRDPVVPSRDAPAPVSRAGAAGLDRKPMLIPMALSAAASPAPEPAPTPPSTGSRFVVAPRVRTCQWPIGNPGEEGFRFCGALQDGGRLPYCGEHRDLARRHPGVSFAMPALRSRG